MEPSCGYEGLKPRNTSKINVSDVVSYHFCPTQFYYQKILGIIPPHLRMLFRIGTREHESFEAKEQKSHDEKPEAEEGKPYVLLMQELPLRDEKYNISGRIDTLYVYGTSYLSDNDTRKVLIIDKKRKMNELYFLQIFGYAHLLEASEKFNFIKPCETFGQIVHNSGTSREILITETKRNEFLEKAESMREHMRRMREGEIPKPQKIGMCFNCFFKAKCWNPQKKLF